MRGTTRSSAAGGVFLCAYLSTTFMLQSARAEPVAKQRWRAFSEHSLQGSHRLSQHSSSSEGLGLQGKRKSTKCKQDRVLGTSCPPTALPLTCSPGTSGAISAATTQKTQFVFRVDHNHCPELFLPCFLTISHGHHQKMTEPQL